LRNRFFFIILATLILSGVGINYVHAYFYKTQRLKLIDRQITESSGILLRSQDFNRAVLNPLAIEETISKVLQGARIGKVFVVRDKQSQIYYQSFNVSLLNADLPTQPEWVTVLTENEYTRVRNIPLEKSGLTLQVGLVLDRNFLDWEIVDLRLINYVMGVVISIFLASVILTLILLSPLRLLIVHLKEATSNLINLKDVRPLPSRLTDYTSGFWSKSDEFSSLLSAVQKLIDRINLNYKLTRSWTFQMAHELKTPLAIIRAETQAKAKSGALPQQYASSIVEEVDHMSETINQFLHALRMSSVVKTVASRLDKLGENRLRIQLKSDFSVFANPIHIDQLIANLVTNSIKFSPRSESVELILDGRSLTVRDHGGGIPVEVRERLGQPFNVGSTENSEAVGNGLGLAWVATVAKLYDWDLKIQSGPNGSEVRINFPAQGDA
jgi:signal transduction histidine kinase